MIEPDLYPKYELNDYNFYGFKNYQMYKDDTSLLKLLDEDLELNQDNKESRE